MGMAAKTGAGSPAMSVPEKGLLLMSMLKEGAMRKFKENTARAFAVTSDNVRGVLRQGKERLRHMLTKARNSLRKWKNKR